MQLLEPANHAMTHRFEFNPGDFLQPEYLQWLTPADRALIELYYTGGNRRMIALALGIHPGSVSRRLSMIHTRFNSRIARVLTRKPCPLPSEIRIAAMSHYVGGQTKRQIAKDLQIPIHTVRRQIDYAQGVLRVIFRHEFKRCV